MEGMTSSSLPTPPRGELFADPAAGVIWAGFLTLSESLKHQLLAALQEHLAIAGDRSTPEGVRVARAVGALHEARDLLNRSQPRSRLTQDAYEALRGEHPEHGWPPESSLRRWLGGADGSSWNTALRRAGLECAPESEVLVARLGGAFTRDEAVSAVRMFIEDFDYAPGMREYIRWAKQPGIKRRPGRRPLSQVAFDRLFQGGWDEVIREAVNVAPGDPSPVVYNGGSARPAGATWSREVRREALCACAKQTGRSPRCSEYMSWRDRMNRDRAEQKLPPLPLPSYSSYHTHYGSWDEALVAAGLEPLGGSATRSNPAGPRVSKRRVSDEELLDLLRRAYADKGSPFTTLAYTAWVDERKAADRAAGRRPRYSSYATIITRFGRWSAACELALGAGH